MQPYVFPYIGYYQLLLSVEKLVMYDDVHFIKQGWINRNRILLNGKDFLFSVPIKDVSSNKLIKDTLIDNSKYVIWVKKFLTTLQQAYKKAPHFHSVFPLIESVFDQEYTSISELAVQSIHTTSRYIGINTRILPTSTIYRNQDLKGKERVIDICKKENAAIYINPSGGKELYSKDEFSQQGIELRFIQPKPLIYKQFNQAFVPWLSIIDVLMFNSQEEIFSFTHNYQLL